MVEQQLPPPIRDPLQARYDVQLVLGQSHGAIHHAVVNANIWLPIDPEGLTREDLEAAYWEVCQEFGVLQAALNTGSFDERLLAAGLGGAQGAAKRKGFFAKVKALCRQVGGSAADFLARMRPALGWSSTIVGSVASALQGEAKRFPGAATAAEAIQEFIELLLNASESSGTGDNGTPNGSVNAVDKRGRGKG